MAEREYQVCTCCVMDTSDGNIVFDENAVCARCNEYKNRILPSWNYGKDGQQKLTALINEIKKR